MVKYKDINNNKVNFKAVLKFKKWNKGANSTINPFLFNSTFTVTSLTLDDIIAIIRSEYDFSDCIVNCSNNGWCKFAGNKTFLCECKENFIGQACQKDLRPCSYSPCLNDGICKSNDTTSVNNQSYVCDCPELYYGKNCEKKIDVCENVTCSENGNCMDVNSVAKCNCFTMYSGDNCEIESQEKETVQKVTKTTSIIAIVTLVVFYGLALLSDILDYCCSNRRHKFKRVKVRRNLIYIP